MTRREQTTLVLVFTAFLIGCVLVLLQTSFEDRWPVLGFLGELGDALIGAAAIAGVFEFWMRREARAELVNIMTYEPTVVSRNISLADAKHLLELKVRETIPDVELAGRICRFMSQQLLSDRAVQAFRLPFWYDFKNVVTLRPAGPGGVFDVEFQISYSRVMQSGSLVFASVRNQKDKEAVVYTPREWISVINPGGKSRRPEVPRIEAWVDREKLVRKSVERHRRYADIRYESTSPTMFDVEKPRDVKYSISYRTRFLDNSVSFVLPFPAERTQIEFEVLNAKQVRAEFTGAFPLGTAEVVQVAKNQIRITNSDLYLPGSTVRFSWELP